MVAEKIKHLREQQGLTQAELSKRLGITRSSVNAWEMGISVPSTQYLVAPGRSVPGSPRTIFWGWSALRSWTCPG